jgi:hypothetical protein
MEHGTTVEQKIEQIVKDMGLSYMCETWTRANLEFDKFRRKGEDKKMQHPEGKTLPACLFVQPVSGRLNYRNGQMKDMPNCFVSFADAMPLDFTGDQAKELTERLKALAIDFILRVNDSRMFEPIDGDIAYTVAFDKLDANLCMFTITPTIKELHGLCIE